MGIKSAILAAVSSLLLVCCADSVSPDATPKGFVYWTDFRGYVFRVSENGGKVDTLHRGLDGPRKLTIAIENQQLLIMHSHGAPNFITQASIKPAGTYRKIVDEYSSPEVTRFYSGITAGKKGDFWATSFASYEMEPGVYITKYNINNMNPVAILKPGDLPDDVIHDGTLVANYAGTKLYFASRHRDISIRQRIHEINSDGTGTPRLVCDIIYDADIATMTIDEVNKRLIFITWGGIISSINMDGTNLQALFNTAGMNVSDIAYGPAKNRLYMTSRSSDKAIYFIEAVPGATLDSLTLSTYGRSVGIAVY